MQEPPDSPSPQISNYVITDFITSIDQVSKVNYLYQSTENQSFCQRMLRSFNILNPSVWIFLILLGILAALAAFSIDLLSETLFGLRHKLSNASSGFTSFLIWTSYSLILALIAAACGRWISPDAEGSGIPEMKTIISGITLYKYLSFQTLLAKTLGLIAASGAGLSIGKEGPFVHISGIIAQKLCKIQFFAHIQQNDTLKSQILAASVAAGVAATFGAPMGGVLFSIEVTSTYYMVSNLWKGVFCAIWCVMCFTFLHLTDTTDLINLTNFEAMSFDWTLIAFVILGVVCGFCGSGFVLVTRKLIFWKQYNPWNAIHERFRYTALVALACAVITYSFNLTQFGDKRIINAMFQQQKLSERSDIDLKDNEVITSLILVCSLKLLLTSISITCPIPSGVFTPIFTAGAILGRLAGELVDIFFGTEHVGVFAVVGAAALTSSVTHTVSVAVIVFELTGQIHYLLPMFVGVLISFAVSYGISMSIYDLLLDVKGLPYLPSIKPSKLYQLKARDIMKPPQVTLIDSGSLLDIGNAISKCGKEFTRIPITDEAGFLLAESNVSDMKKYLWLCYQQEKGNLPRQAIQNINEFLNHIAGVHPNSPDFELGNVYRKYSDEITAEQNQFWMLPIDHKLEHLVIETAPFSVPESTPVAKLHFLFTMLGLTQAYVTRKGKLEGVINRDSFLLPK